MRLVLELNNNDLERLKRLKKRDGYEAKPWEEWLRYLTREATQEEGLVEHVHMNTRRMLLPTWMDNFALNLPFIRAEDALSIRDLSPPPDKRWMGPAIVVGRGPSIFKHRHLETLAESKFNGVIVAADGALLECLNRGVIPDYVVTVDGNRELIAKWYDDPAVEKHADRVKAVLVTQVAPNVRDTLIKMGVKIYWYLPISDNCYLQDSATQSEMWMTAGPRNPKGVPAMAVAGNSGAAAWVLAWNVLRRNPVGLIGLDYGYPEDTPLEETYYYKTICGQLDKDKVIAAVKAEPYYERVYHPVFETYAMIDPVFKAYRQVLLDVIQRVPSDLNTVNCTEGGTLWGPSMDCMRFKDFLALAETTVVS